MYKEGQTLVSRRLPAKEFTIVKVLGPSSFMVKNENGKIVKKTLDQVYIHPMHWHNESI